MNDRVEKWLRTAAIVLAVLTAVTAVLFIYQALDIYLTGVSAANQPSPGVYLEQIYSPKTIGAHFAPIAPLVYLWLFCCVAMLILRAVFPGAKEKPVVAGLKQWREKQLAKKAAAEGKKKPNTRKIALCAMVIALALIVIGIFNGSMHDVFVKAVNICTECVGLG